MRRSTVWVIAGVMGLFGCGPQEANVGAGDVEPLDEAAGKIVGGADTTIATHPHQVALMDSSFFQFSGGSIVSDRWVLTANHCVEGTSASSLRVGAGSSRLSSVRTTGQLRSVTRIVRYPGYTSPEHGHDVALLELATPLDLSGPNAKAIGLVSASDATAGAAATGSAAIVTGWGTLSSGGSSTPDVLQAVTVSVIAQSTAQQEYGSSNVTADQLAAAAPGKDSCQGDSGGPLTVSVGGVRKLAGVVSWGNGCADARYAGMYARVSSFESWIAQTIGAVTTTPPPSTAVLLDQSGLSAARGSWVRRTVTVPQGSTSFTVVIQGGSGDADLYVRFGTQPSTTAYDCRPYTDSSNETCTFANPSPGTWHIGVRAYQSFSGLSARATLP